MVTNLDKIRTLNPRELGRFINAHFVTSACQGRKSCKGCASITCKAGINDELVIEHLMAEYNHLDKEDEPVKR
jgi:hypothetical protein